jgi:hypothetical protein
VALLEKRGFLYNHSGDFPQVILIVPSHMPNNYYSEHDKNNHIVYYIIFYPRAIIKQDHYMKNFLRYAKPFCVAVIAKSAVFSSTEKRQVIQAKEKKPTIELRTL